jgi:WD40 repeat protein
VRGSLAFSPDGKLLAAAAESGVTLWETATGRKVRQIDAPAMHLSFSSDGKRLACSANQCRVFEVASGKELFAVEGGQGAFSGDGKKLVTADSFGTTLRVYVWDTATGRQLRQSPQERGEFRGLILAVGEQTFAVLESGGLGVTIRDIATGEKRRFIRNTARIRGINMPDGWTSLALTGDGKKLATANTRGVELWDVASGEFLGGWQGRVQSRPVFSPDGKRLAWVGFDDKGGPTRLWTIERDGAMPRAVGEPVNNFEPPCFSPDGKVLAVVTDAHVISLREVVSGKEVVSLDAHTRPVIDVAVSTDARQVISRGDNDIHVWETRTGKLLGRHALLPSGHEYLGPLLPGGYLLTGERTSNPLQGRFWLRDMRTGEEVLRFDGRPDVGPPTVVAAPGGRYVAVRGRAGEICVLDVPARRCVYRLDPKEAASGLKLSADGDVLVWYNRTPTGFEVHVHRPKSGKTLVLRDMPKTDRWYWIFDRQPCVSPDGRWLVLSTEEGRLRRWDLLTGKELSPLTEALRTNWELCWSPDGRFVAAQGSASPANVIDREARRDLRVWDVRTGTRLAHLTVPNPHGGMHVLFAHDSRTMLTADLQGVIHLWEVATGKERGRLRGHLSYEIGSLVLSADGRMLVSGGYDSQVLMWDLTGRMLDGQWHTARQPAEKLRTAWEALAADDAKAAYAALWQLAADPEGTIALLRERLRPVPRPEADQVKRLIAELDSEDFTRRQHGRRELELLEEAAAPELHQVLTRKPSLEVRRRVEALLERLNRLPAGEQLQALRAIEVLEHIGTSEARNVLRKLADGAPAARVTQEAKASLRR